MDTTYICKSPSPIEGEGHKVARRVSLRDLVLRSRLARSPSILAALMVTLALASAPQAAEPSPPFQKSIAEVTAKLKRLDGLVPLYLDIDGGRVLMQFPATDADGVLGRYLYQVYLSAGVGSNPIGLDRSKPGPTQIIVFRRAGEKIIAEYENDSFRAEDGNADEKQAVAQSFATSTIWAGDIVAQGPDGSVLVDISSFLTRDVNGFVDALKAAHQGDFKLDRDLSYPDVAGVQSFPENIELEAKETFDSDQPGDEVQGIAPDPHVVSIVTHHSLIKLPSPGFKPRLFDSRTGASAEVVADYSAPLDAPVVYRLASRFRLQKTDPTAARSTVKKPIVFYVDRAAPEPVRTALIEGARWWAKAFDAAGFIDAFRVEVLPQGVSPLDARYNVINWVHRQTRGWSYGQGIVDPRTGEIVKGSVLLGSLRVRQDRLIFEGLAGADKTDHGAQDDPIVISLARLRQLAVHETGHALGFEHNFAGSTFDDRASVMDYPPPRIKITPSGDLDFTDAYQVGIGTWDRFIVKWLYSETPPGVDEAKTLDAIIRDGYASGLRFVSDTNSRPVDSAQPWGNLWDDGPDAVASLNHVLAVRKIALSRFGLRNLPDGAPVADLKRIIVPIYLFHRYEVDATAKLIGGVYYPYAIKGDGHETATPASGAEQRRALAALLTTLDPNLLDLPDSLLHLLDSAQLGQADKQYDVEVFGDPADPVFDLPGAADTAADLTLSALLHPHRLNRVGDQGARDPGSLTLGELLNTTVAAVFMPEPTSRSHAAELRRRIRMRLVIDLARVLEDKRLSPTAAAEVKATLTALGQKLAAAKAGSPADLAQDRYLSAILLDTTRDALGKLVDAQKGTMTTAPPGMPIGEDDGFEAGRYDSSFSRDANTRTMLHSTH
jgi:hypothetical protein